MNRRLHLELYACRLRKGRIAGRGELRWLDASAEEGPPVSGATLKLVRLMRANQNRSHGGVQPASSST